MYNILGWRFPLYEEYQTELELYRLAYVSGRQFLNRYLVKYTDRESDEAFAARLDMTYVPSFARMLVTNVAEQLSQRLCDVRRRGDRGYVNVMAGEEFGVDYSGRTMNDYLAQYIIPEMLVKGRVGVFIDMPANITGNLAADVGKHPYLVYYQAEQIWNYSFRDSNCTGLLVAANTNTYEKGMCVGLGVEYRRYSVSSAGMLLEKFVKNEKSGSYDLISENLVPGLYKVPFVMFDIGDSLMKDIARYQVAMMNLSSSDISFLWHGNFPLYTEQRNQKETNFAKWTGNKEGEAPAREIGAMQGVSYPVGTERPGWINPSSEPLMASMKKQESMVQDMYTLLNNNFAMIAGRHASAESKREDKTSQEAGMTAIGRILEAGEKGIIRAWEYYTGETGTVCYPENMALKTHRDRREECTEILNLSDRMPSYLGKKELLKVAAMVLYTEPEEIVAEIEKNKYTVSVGDQIRADLESGIVDCRTASLARGYDPSIVEMAKLEKIQQVRAIYEAQANVPKAQSGGTINPGKDSGGGDGAPVKLNRPDGTDRAVET